MRLVRFVVVVVGTLVVMVSLALFVFPTRTYLDQRSAISRAEEQLDVLAARTEALRERGALLDSDEELERLAREEYGLVMPGEEAYVVLPPPVPPVDLPGLWLFGDPDREPGKADAAVPLDELPEQPPVTAPVAD